MTTTEAESTLLPGNPPQVLRDALAQHTPRVRVAFMEHLAGFTSADYLADWLSRAGTPVSATTIKQYRRTLA